MFRSTPKSKAKAQMTLASRPVGSSELGSAKHSQLATLLLVAVVGFFASFNSRAFALEKRPFEMALFATEKTYFVALDGSDAEPGTIDRPWATINHAAEKVSAGDMVVVRGGRYVLTRQVRPRNSGRSKQWITFVGYPGEQPAVWYL
jgi:hypothetical protein